MIISEALHIVVNQGNDIENKLLNNGLSFVVEAGTETALTLEEIQLKILKLLKMLQQNVKSFQFLAKDTLYQCCYN